MRRPMLPLAALLVAVLAAAALTPALEAQRRRPAPRRESPSAARQAQPPSPRAPATALAPAPALAAPLPGALSPRNANYLIEVRLDPTSHTLAGSEVLTWRNIASVSTSELRFHLYYNAWKNSRSTWIREAMLAATRGRLADRARDDFSWIDVTSIRLDSRDAPLADLTAEKHFVSPDDGNPDDQTVMAVPLPRPVAPGQTIKVLVTWTSKIPRTFSRTGAVDSSFFLAQWFPKIGVLEDTGWNCHQFHSGTEFFADYGEYDVSMTVPRAWVVGATGLERERRDNPDGTTTHRYYQQDVHDFAWTTSPSYVERKARFEEPGLPPVEMRLLLQREHEGQAERHFRATRAALKYYGTWFGAYPYPHITIVDPAWQSGAGGMEYPTLFTAGTRWLTPADVTRPEGVTVHECGHQFWYAIVGNNEFEDAWMDEGLNTFSTGRTIDQFFRNNYLERRYFGGFVPYVVRDIRLTRETDENSLAGYRSAAKSDAQSTPSYRYWPATGSGLSYDKTALWLNTLERYLGWPTLQKGMSAYFAAWKFRHPKPQDFFDAISTAAGRDMTWFFDQVYRSSNVFDYGVARLTSDPVGGRGIFDKGRGREFIADNRVPGLFRTNVVVRRYGEAIFPVDVLVVFEDGQRVREHWDGGERWKLYTYDRRAKARYAQVDPDRVLLLDVNYTNNGRTLEPKSDAASTKWMLKWMVWVQDLMGTYAFFV